jgi:DNA mismatch repair protein MutS2
VIYPVNFEEKIGFNSIRKMLKSFCISVMGVELAEQLAFTTNIHDISSSLEQEEAFRRLMDSGMPFAVKDYTDLRPELHRIRIDGTIIELEAMFELKLMLNIIQQLIQFYDSDASAGYEALRALIAGIKVEKLLMKEVNRLVDDNGEIPDNASAELLEIRKEIRKKHHAVERRIRQLLGEAKSAGWTDSDVEITVRNGRLVIPVKAADKRKLRGLIHDESATGQTVYIEPTEIFETNNEIRELEYAEKRELNRILLAFTILLRPHLPMMHLAWQMLGHIDFVHARARLGKKIKGTKPQLLNKPHLDWKQARHPLLEMSLHEQHKQIVPLDIQLDQANRILVISGPNAGGKSVCLKTTGLLQYMLQCGLSVPMQSNSVCGLFSSVFIDIGDEQSLENDLSTYSSHLLNMKNYLQFADDQTLFLIDEFGTGTEPQLGGAIAEAVLTELNEKKAFGLITTHYANLKLVADNAEGIQNAAMLFDTRKLQPLYSLRIGNPGSSFAFEIARKIGFPESTLSKAAEITGHSQLNFDEQLQQLEIEKKEIAKKQTELRLADELLSEVVEKYQTMLQQLEEKKKQLITQAGQEARLIIDKANKQIEHAIKEIRESQAEKERTREIRARLQQSRDQLVEEAVAQAEVMLSQEEEEVEEDTLLQPGDMVRIEEMDIQGELLAISKHEAVILFNQVKLRTSPEKLSKLGRKESQKLRETTQPKRRGGSFGSDLNEKAGQFKLTIDVRGMRAEEAIGQVEKYIDEALLLSFKEISVLHGKGNGVLRKVVRDFLSKQKAVQTFGDAPAEAGGHGITRISLK